jgi:tRNA threonylcarbamoyl adenosine modification protein YeaZ
MRILGIDTTTKFLSLGLYDDKRVYEYNMDLGKRHSTLLIPTIKRILLALGWSMEKIDYFACGLGPGSFTGIRVGLSTIKGISWSLHKPVVGIPTLDILASKVKRDDALIVPVIDAKRGLVYCSIYKRKKGALKRIAPYMLLSQEKLFHKIKRGSVILGDALDLYKDKILKNVSGAVILDKDYWYPDGHSIISLALEKIKNRMFNTSFDISPIYLYPKECQIKKA